MVTPSEGEEPPFGFGLTAPNLSFEATFFDLIGASGQAGSRLDLSGDIAIQNPGLETSSVVVNGTSYPAIYPGGVLTFSAVPFVLPPGTDLEPFRFSAPFTMNGQLQGFSDPLRLTAPLFDVDVTGAGTADVTGNVHGNGSNAFYLGDFVNYTFAAAAPSPTPEPASLLLLGIGFLGLLWGRALRADHRS